MVGYSEMAVQYTAQILVEEFQAVCGDSRFVPIKLLFKDEKYTDENIQILQEYSRECNLTSSPQV